MSEAPQPPAPERAYPLREGERWYAVYTLPHREAGAQLQLENQGFRTFLPQYSKTVRHARKVQIKPAPLFPRYLLVVLELERDRWRSVNGSFGVSSLVMQGERPAPVLHGVVETLIASRATGDRIRFVPDLKPGQRVRLVAGPFAEQLGVLERLDDVGRVRVLLEIMGGQIPIQLSRDNVFPATS